MKRHNFLDLMLQVLCCCSGVPSEKEDTYLEPHYYLEAAGNFEVNKNQFNFAVPPNLSYQKQWDGRSTGGEHERTEGKQDWKMSKCPVTIRIPEEQLGGGNHSSGRSPGLESFFPFSLLGDREQDFIIKHFTVTCKKSSLSTTNKYTYINSSRGQLYPKKLGQSITLLVMFFLNLTTYNLVHITATSA